MIMDKVYDSSCREDINNSAIFVNTYLKLSPVKIKELVLARFPYAVIKETTWRGGSGFIVVDGEEKSLVFNWADTPPRDEDAAWLNVVRSLCGVITF